MPVIRPATMADADCIVKIAHQTWWPTYRDILSTEQITHMLEAIYISDKIAEQIESGIQQYLILEEDEEPVAFAAYSPREDDAQIYKLHKLYCLPKTQGKGYGKILMEAVTNEVKQAGKQVLELNVNRNNNAKSFYEKMGFNVAYEEDVPIGPYWMNDYVMRRNL
ncbi:GNAT family N-acetyltransferase [Mucilaginibacter sp. PAMB04274]|uniref:GNAT family N-acetyltransferase n=1 Tax=Mucilaginibacter sp. PAMB04274 TaxID=3138568 RepID=UPI0031F63AE0